MSMAVDQANGIARAFVDLSDEQLRSIDDSYALLFATQRSSLGWPELLKSPRILIISEAGSGKTYECRKIQTNLFDAGEPAFFFELSELATATTAQSLLAPSARERFQQWSRSGTGIATFFLDAVDELRLTRGSFRTALLRLLDAVGEQLDRVRLVVTSRPIPFDRRELQQLFPVSVPTAAIPNFADIVLGKQPQRIEQADKEKAPAAWRTVGLLPLTEEMMFAFAKNRGVKKPADLLADLRGRNAFEFARRPQDLIELCADWADHQRVRTHLEQVEQNVRVKLLAREDRAEPAPLSPEKAKDGASRLALAALLTRKLTLRHSAEADEDGEPGTALDPAKILTDWSAHERQTLLERPLFSYASYGRVRFHHRSVLEFLASCHLDGLLARGMSRRAVRRLLFATTPQGIAVVKPTMRPVAAWLAIRHSDIFQGIVDSEPNVLFDHGDPASLSDGHKRDILQAYVTRFGPGGWRGAHVPRMQVQRFASADLGEAIVALWRTGIENAEVRELLLEIAVAAPLVGMAEIAGETYMDATAEMLERIDALRLLVRLNGVQLPQIVEAMTLDPDRWPNRVRQYALIELFPSHLTIAALSNIIESITPSTSTVDSITWNWPEQILDIPLSALYLRDLRDLLLNLVLERATWNDAHHQLQTDRQHLTQALAATCFRELQMGTRGADISEAAVAAIRFGEDRSYSDERPIARLRKLLQDLPATDRAEVFWAEARLLLHFRPGVDSWQCFCDIAFHNAVLSLDHAKDTGWATAALGNKELSLHDRSLALHVTTRVAVPSNGNLEDHWKVLRRAVDDKPELAAQLEEFLRPRVPSPQEIAWRIKDEQNGKTSKNKGERDRTSWEKFQREVIADPAGKFAPEKSYNTSWNLWTAMKLGDEDREIGWDRAFVETHFNSNIADRLRVAMMGHWREEKPLLRSERPVEDRNTFYWSWHFALSGIYAEAEDPNWAHKLSPQEAALAARTATTKLNGFPQWLNDLALAHPTTVEAALGPDVTAELEEAEGWSSYLQSLRDCGNALASLFMPRILAWFDQVVAQKDAVAKGTEAVERLEQSVKVMLRHADRTTTEHLRAMADAELANDANGIFTSVWLPLLFQLDPAAGADRFEAILEAIEPSSGSAAVGWFARLFGDRHSRGISINLGTPEFSPAILLRLILLAYRHVRRDDDVSHEGTYSPDVRDDAQTARNALLDALLKKEGSDAWAAKLALANDLALSHFRDRALALAQESCAQEADNVQFSETACVELNRRLELAPISRDDMFALLSDRLDDLEDALRRDTSPKEVWAMIGQEFLMRRVIAGHLEHLANGQYVVDQEAVTAEEKETDIRLISTASQVQGVIELKLADNRSARDLRDTISGQLVQRYLSPESRRAGCLLITLARDRGFDHPETGERMTVEQLVEFLQAEARRVEESLRGEVRLMVRLLDLRPG